MDEVAAETSILIQGYIKNFINLEKPEPLQEPVTTPEPKSPPRVWDPISKTYHDSNTKNPIHNSEDV